MDIMSIYVIVMFIIACIVVVKTFAFDALKSLERDKKS